MTKIYFFKCLYGLVIHSANPMAGKQSTKFSFTIRDSYEDTINVEIKLGDISTSNGIYQQLNQMETIVKITNPEFIKIEEGDKLFRPFTLG
jgi:hypothetical protein